MTDDELKRLLSWFTSLYRSRRSQEMAGSILADGFVPMIKRSVGWGSSRCLTPYSDQVVRAFIVRQLLTIPLVQTFGRRFVIAQRTALPITHNSRDLVG